MNVARGCGIGDKKELLHRLEYYAAEPYEITTREEQQRIGIKKM